MVSSKINASRCVFINNSAAKGGAVYIGHGTGEITSSVIINNTLYSHYPQINVEGNWWGVNNPNWTDILNNINIPAGHVTLNTSAVLDEVTFTFYANNQIAGSIPKRFVDFINSGYIENGIFKTHVTSPSNPVAYVDSQIIHLNVTIPVLDMSNVTKYFSAGDKLKVSFHYSNNTAIVNKTLKININGKQYLRTTDFNGSAYLNLNLNSGTYIAYASCYNISATSTVTILPTIESFDVVKVFRNNTQYLATFKDNKGNLLSDFNITLNINGVVYYRMTGMSGISKLNLNLEAGNYTITAFNPSTGEKSVNSIEIISLIQKNNNLVKYYRNESRFTVQIIDSDGQSVKSGEIVTFNINGIFYNRTTNMDGIVSLAINLEAGSYIITSEYKKSKVSNTIQVLTVIKTDNLVMNYGDGSKFSAAILDGRGNNYPLQKVTFNINGILYVKNTDSNGIVSLNINLQSGKYIITTSYNSLNMANTITVN